MTVRFSDFILCSSAYGDIDKKTDFVVYDDGDVMIDIAENANRVYIHIEDMREIVKFWDEHPEFHEKNK